MEELRQVLIAHAKKYRIMQPTDAVKLIYQNEFGGGHLIKNEAACMNYLFREYDTIAKNAQNELCESIGNGLVRVNLTAINREQLEPLGHAFIRGAAQHKGTMERFRHKLGTLKALTAVGYFPFSADQLDKYLKEYAAEGFPAVSHSPQYRKTYQPSYRVVRYCDFVTEFSAYSGYDINERSDF